MIGKDALIAFAYRVRDAAETRDWRHAIALCGSPAWGHDSAEVIRAALAPTRFLWLGTPGAARAEPFQNAFCHLGREVDLLVYDAHAGLDPDAFGAAVGSLVGGGLLLLLVPPWADWPRAPDPQMARLAVHPFDAGEITNRFVSRMARVLRNHEGLITLQQHDTAPPAWAMAEAVVDLASGLADAPCRTDDQAAAVAAIVQVAREEHARPLVITADRGRGKSAALGIAAAELLRTDPLRIVASGPRRAAVDALFDHAARLLPKAARSAASLRSDGGELQFMAPDALLASLPDADLVLVDEAAALPASLLKRLLAAYPRIVFATTVHGYEGSGRGFALRFRDALDEYTPGWRALHLTTPIRWAPGDPLEDLVFRALLLDAEPAVQEVPVSEAGIDYEILRLDRDRLADDEPLLRQLFGLLIAAHYRTTPLDLRHLLDGPNLQIWAARRGAVVLGTLLAAEEGGFDDVLAHEVWAGRRRPRGHLLPETLSAHLGLEQATMHRGMRVIRIAVHETVRRRGIGSMLVARLCEEAEGEGMDFVGAAFAATEAVLAFWHSLGMRPVRLGNRRETTSGTHSVLVMRGLGTAGCKLADEARRRYLLDLPWQLADASGDIEPGLAEVLKRNEGSGQASDARVDRRLIEGFAFEQRPFESTAAALYRMMERHRGRIAGELERQLREALTLRVAQHRTWAESTQALGMPGRARLIEVLREAAAALLRLSGDEGHPDSHP